jgi:hypothetical protein
MDFTATVKRRRFERLGQELLGPFLMKQARHGCGSAATCARRSSSVA